MASGAIYYDHITLPAASAAVLGNAARHVDAIANAGWPLGPSGSEPDGAGVENGRDLLRRAAAAVLHNAQLASRAFVRTCEASEGSGGGASSGGSELGGGPMLQEPLPVLAPGERYRWRPKQLQALARYVSSLLPGSRISGRQAAKALGYELWIADSKAYQRLAEKLGYIRRQLYHGRDPAASGGNPSARVPPGTYQWKVWLRRAFAALPNMTGTVTDVAAVLEADPDIAPRLDRRPNASFSNTPTWKRHASKEMRTLPELVPTGQRVRGDQGRRQTVYRLDEQVARLQLERRPAKARKRGVPGLSQLGKKTN